MARKPETMLSMQCTNNPFERAIDVCDECGLPFSREFLVYPRGDRRPPFCKACAIAMSGVRHAARRPRMVDCQELRRRMSRSVDYPRRPGPSHAAPGGPRGVREKGQDGE